MLNFLYKTASVKASYNSSMAVPLRFKHSYFDLKPQTFTVSYLTNLCGLSPKQASENVNYENSQEPKLVKNYGFSTPEIFKRINIKIPGIVSVDPEKAISPKFDFFRAKVVSTPELVRIFKAHPIIDGTRGKYSVINGGTYVDSYRWIRGCFVSYPNGSNVILNLNILRQNVGRFMFSDKFRKIVEEVREIRFNPLQSMTKPDRDGIVEIYKRFTFHGNSYAPAFPCLLSVSCSLSFPFPLSVPEYILEITFSRVSFRLVTTRMDFYVNKLGLESCVIVNCSVPLSVRLEWLIEKGAAIQFLCSKGVVDLESVIAARKCEDNFFLEKFVNCFKEARGGNGTGWEQEHGCILRIHM